MPLKQNEPLIVPSQNLRLCYLRFYNLFVGLLLEQSGLSSNPSLNPSSILRIRFTVNICLIFPDPSQPRNYPQLKTHIRSIWVCLKPLSSRGLRSTQNPVKAKDGCPYCGWRKPISHHLRNPGMQIRLPYKYRQTLWFSGF